MKAVPITNGTSCRSDFLKGFTLVELLLVIAIMGIIAAITVPNLARSVRGNRIRVATRTVISASRFARNISILRESEHALVLDLDNGSISVSEEIAALPTNAVNEAEAPEERPLDQDEEADTVVFSSGRAFAPKGEFFRELEGVTIEEVEIAGSEVYAEGRAVVVFQSNGRCDPYVIKLTDETGKVVVIDVDALAATETEEIEP